jgi:hypothetical protein
MSKRNGISPALIRRVRKLEAECDAALHKRGSMSSGNKVEVDYFAVCDLIDYFKETREAARRVIVARDALHQVFFSSDG